MRLRRTGTKARPFYRVVVAPSSAGRNGRFVETIGTYDPVVKPVVIKIDEARALHWLMEGAQPTETTAYVLNKAGILEQYFAQRPAARKQYSFLDKRTAATSSSVIEHPAATVAPEPAPAPAPEPVAEAAPVEEPAAVPEPAAEPEPTPAEEPAAEEAAPAESAE